MSDVSCGAFISSWSDFEFSSPVLLESDVPVLLELLAADGRETLSLSG